MIVIPAIDIKDGSCVRLMMGDYATAHKVAEDPAAAAQDFYNQGASWLHMVDLDGAKDGKRVNEETILGVRGAVTMKIEVGGGIRDLDAVEFYLKNGMAIIIM